MKNISRFVSCIVVICFAITLSIVAVSIPKVNNLKIANAQDDQFQKYDVTSDDFALACDSSGLDELSWADSLVYQKYPYGQCSNQYSGRNTPNPGPSIDFSPQGDSFPFDYFAEVDDNGLLVHDISCQIETEDGIEATNDPALCHYGIDYQISFRRTADNFEENGGFLDSIPENEVGLFTVFVSVKNSEIFNEVDHLRLGLFRVVPAQIYFAPGLGGNGENYELIKFYDKVYDATYKPVMSEYHLLGIKNNAETGGSDTQNDDRVKIDTKNCDMQTVDTDSRKPVKDVDHINGTVVSVLIKSCPLIGDDKDKFNFTVTDNGSSLMVYDSLKITPKTLRIKAQSITKNQGVQIASSDLKYTVLEDYVNATDKALYSSFFNNSKVAIKSGCVNINIPNVYKDCVIADPKNPFPQTLGPVLNSKGDRYKDYVTQFQTASVKINSVPCPKDKPYGAYPNCSQYKPVNCSADQIEKDGKCVALGKACPAGTTGVYPKCVNTVVKVTLVSGVQISPVKVTLNVGKKLELAATVYPLDATNKSVVWSSKNKKIVTVDKDGVITALRVGKTEIVATSSDGTKKSSSIEVRTPLADLKKSKIPSLTDLGKKSKVPAHRVTAIKWLSKKGITQCFSAKTQKVIYKCAYNPWTSVNKGAMSQFLWKLIGSPKYTGQKTSYFKKDKTVTVFKKSNLERFNTIQWLVNEKVVKGTGKFNANKAITRAEMALWMYRVAGKPKLTSSESKKVKKMFADIKSTSTSETSKAIWWLAYNEITTGTKIGKKVYYKSKNPVNRGSMAEFLMKLHNTLIK